MTEPGLTPMQLREARTILGWSRLRLAVRMGISYTTISQFENHGLAFRAFDPRKAREILEAEGVEFVARKGGRANVRLRKGGTERGAS
jgi:transcriptional regulator with XRE-family HTH domain